MTVKDKKLKEAELVDQQTAPATAQPAQPAEIAAAQEPVASEPVMEEPAVEEPVESTAQVPVTPTDPMTPPAPGMIPSGWVRPEDLAAAVAQATGDVEVAQTAPDAAVTDQPLVQEPVAEEPVLESCKRKKKALTEADASFNNKAAKAADLEQPLASDSKEDQAPVDALQEDCDEIEDEEHMDVAEMTESEDETPEEDQEESLTEEEENLEEEPLTEADEHSDGDAAETCDNVKDEMEANAAARAAAPMAEACEDCCPKCGKNPCECEEDKIEEGIDNIDPVDENDTDSMNEAVEDDIDEDEDSDTFDMDILEDNPDFDMSLFEEPADDFDTEFNFDADIHTDDREEALEGAADTLANTSDFIKSLLVDPMDDVEEYSDDEEDPDEEDDLDEEDFDDVDLEECISRIPVSLPRKEIVKDTKPARRVLRVQESQDVWYPAGSSPDDTAENLVREYEKSSAARRLALAQLRESVKQRRLQENESQKRFNEALSRSSRLVETREEKPADSWENSRFYEKYQEREKLDYRELLQKGFLG